MNIKRFYAPTAREALAKARMVFGDGTLILSNRQTSGGVEVMATAEETLQDMDAGLPSRSPLQDALDRRAADEGGSLRKEASPQTAQSTLEHVQARHQQAQEGQGRATRSQVHEGAGSAFGAGGRGATVHEHAVVSGLCA